MFSDNENPGADISAGQTATAAAAAQEQTTNVEVDQAMPVAVEAQTPLLGAEPAPPPEPAAVTVAPPSLWPRRMALPLSSIPT
jgi:hypothetical protein